MNIRLRKLVIRTRKTTEVVEFGQVTFLHGPVGTGKSTVARLIDYCFGGDLERTPAIQQEFVAVDLDVVLGGNECTIERGATDTQSVRVSWVAPDGPQSLNVPLDPGPQTLIGEEVHNLSDLIFYLCGVAPIKVRKNSTELNAPLVRLSFRDIWVYCYLDQTHLDSSFFRLEHPFRGRKSQDAMRFITGLHSEKLSQLEMQLARTIDDQRVKRESVTQIREFMQRFDLGSEIEMQSQLDDARRELASARARKKSLEQSRRSDTHPSDSLRVRLREISAEVEAIDRAIADATDALDEQRALQAELVTAKTKAHRMQQAGRVLEGVAYRCCPQCGTDVSTRPTSEEHCSLCGSEPRLAASSPLDVELLRKDLNERIDQIADAMSRRKHEVSRMRKALDKAQAKKSTLDRELEDVLARYDSAFVESIREVEGLIATWVERIRSIEKLREMPTAISELERRAGELQGKIDNIVSAVQEERSRLKHGDAHVQAIAQAFKRTMLEVGFPGVSTSDEVVLEPRNWNPVVVHGEQRWAFWDTGSGGKKTLYNVCYALALHSVALERNLPLPKLLIVDSPTKNISDDENPELVRALYAAAYKLVGGPIESSLQLLLIDSDLVLPESAVPSLIERRMAGEGNAPALIPYYIGP